MRLKKIFGELLIMSKAERNGSLVLLTLLFILIIIRFVAPDLVKDDRTYLNEIEGKISQLEYQKDSLKALTLNNSTANLANANLKNNDVPKNIVPKNDEADIIEYFSFDPNTETFTNLVKLGFSKKVANTLICFRTSGAHFYQPEDLLKVYGVDTLLFNRLKPFITIVLDEKKRDDNEPLYKTRAPNSKIEVNSADSAVWTTLPGIGPVFARRICNFRKLLGGFVAIEQIAEVYKLPDETYQRIRPYLTIDTSKVKKINLNFADVVELAKHPYCDYSTARKIVNYRVQNGSYTSAQQLLSDSLLSRINFEKFEYYLVVN